MNLRFHLSTLLLALATVPAAAQNTATAPATAAATAASTALPVVAAEVRRVDLAAQSITLKHQDIPNLDMPPMTMVFRLQTPAQAAGLKPGDRVRFSATQVQGAYTVLDIQRDEASR